MSDCSETDDVKCCGCGCNNCVLDDHKGVSSHSLQLNKENILTVDGRKYIKFCLESKSKCTENVWRFDFAYVDRDNLHLASMGLTIPPGCHIMMRVSDIDEDNDLTDRHDRTTVGNFVSRPYTPIHVDPMNATFGIIVKFEPQGLMSKYLQDISIGDIVEVKGPYGDFKWTANSFEHLICISQGVGVAPMFAIVQDILNNENDETWIDFVSCFRSIDDMLLREEIYNFQQYWNFQSLIFLSNERSCVCDVEERIRNCSCIQRKLKYNENLCTFRLDEIELSKLFIKKRIENCLILICGTTQFIKSIKISLKNLHIKEENIFVFD